MAARDYQSDPSGGLTPDDYNYYRTARWRVADTAALGLEQNEYQQRLARNAYGRNKTNLSDQFARMSEKFAGPYAGRGLLNSGIYNKDLTDFRVGRERQMGDLRMAYEDQLAGLNQARSQIERTHGSTLTDLNVQEQARRATADALRTAVY